MRPEVIAFLELGVLPSADADPTEIEVAETTLLAIPDPLTDEEAEALLSCFGKDDCFGLAWSLVHLIESAPTPLPKMRPTDSDNPWLQRLYDRAQ